MVKASVPESDETKAPNEETLRGLDALATERIAALSSLGPSSSSSTAAGVGRGWVLKWLGQEGR